MIQITQAQQNQDIFSTEENRKLLYKYLIKFYQSEKQFPIDKAKSMAQKLINQYSTNLFGEKSLSWWLGSKSIEYFCLYYLQDTFTPKPDNIARELAPVHYSTWNELESMFVKDNTDKLLLVMPRGAAKTTVCDFALSVWAHCYKVSIYTLVAGRTEQDAVEFIREIRRAFEENQYIINTFGKLIDTRKYTVNKLELELTNETKIQAISSTSSLRGKKFNGHRPSLIIADDYQGKSDVITQEARDKKYNTWVQDSVYAGDKPVIRNSKKVKMGTKFIVLGTILHRDCFMSRLIRDKSYKSIVHRAVLVDDVDELFNSNLWVEFKKLYFNSKSNDPVAEAKEFYYQNEQQMQYPVLWEDKWDCLELAIDYYSNPQAFKQELQNDASKIGQKAFHLATTKPASVIEEQEFTKTILCCDPAVEVGVRNDYTALLVGSKTPNNFRWVRRGLVEKIKFDDYIKKVIELLHDYPDISAIWVEKNTYNGADVREIEKRIDSDIILKSRNISIINERQHKNKEAKIRAISAKVDSGFIIFNEDDRDFVNQILDYEGEGYSLHDDAPDVLAEFDRLIDIVEEEIQPIKFYPRDWLF